MYAKMEKNIVSGPAKKNWTSGLFYLFISVLRGRWRSIESFPRFFAVVSQNNDPKKVV